MNDFLKGEDSEGRIGNLSISERRAPTKASSGGASEGKESSGVFLEVEGIFENGKEFQEREEVPLGKVVSSLRPQNARSRKEGDCSYWMDVYSRERKKSPGSPHITQGKKKT